jgi:hypothetical protein
MARSPEPVVLELASLPREQVGPFLLLGLDKAATKEEVDAHWAERLKWARKQQFKVPLEDVNWARDILGDLERWVRADAASLNADTTEGALASLAGRYGVGPGRNGRLWQALDSEKALADYMPAAEVPDPDAVRAALVVPEIPEELPAVPLLLERLAQQPLDPWALELPGAPGSPLSAELARRASEGNR